MTDTDCRFARIACAVLAAGAFACGPSHKSDGGSDASSPDGGNACTLVADGGMIALQVAANPNDVLTAVATVQFSTCVTQLDITVQTDGGMSQQTPVHSTDGGASPATLPVLLLKADTSYTFQAVGQDSAGTQYASNTVALTTGPMPTQASGESLFPVWAVADGGVASAGYTLLASQIGTGFQFSGAPDFVQIVDGTGATVWYYEASPPLIGDFQQQPDGTFTLALYDSNAPVLPIAEPLATYRQIDVLGKTLHTWTAQNFVDPRGDGGTIMVPATDEHDIRIQPNGDALLLGFVLDAGDASSIIQGGTPGPSNATIVTDVLERVTADGGVTFAWNSEDFVGVDDADPGCLPIAAQSVDLTHANAIDVMDDGNYLLSLRNMSLIVKIDSTTGDVIWALGKTPTEPYQTFTFSPAASVPSCQHGVRELQANNSGCVASCPSGQAMCPNHCGNIIMFDNGDGYAVEASKAVEYDLNTTTWTATLVWSSDYVTQLGTACESPAGGCVSAGTCCDDNATCDTSTGQCGSAYSYIHGYAHRLLNGNTLVDYGMDHTVQEVDATGSQVLWQLTDTTGIDNSAIYGIYRAYRLPSLYAYKQ